MGVQNFRMIQQSVGVPINVCTARGNYYFC